MVRERTAELTRANELLEKMFSSINVMIAYMDKDFNFIRVNRAYAEADEREPDFFIGKNHFHLYPNEENQRIFRKVVETGQPYLAYEKPFEYAEHPDRGVTYWDWSLQPVRETDGSVGGLILSVLNVTDRVRAQERIEAERRRFNEVLESLPVFVALVTQEGLIRFANRVFRERFGGFCKRGYFEFMLGQAEPCEVCETYKAPKTSAPVRGEWSGPDGHIYEIFEFPFTDTDGSALILYMGVDITDQKEAQKQIEATNALLSLFLRMSSRKEFLDRVVELLQDWSGCRCAGIRVVDRQGNIPYDSYRGFSREFWESENFLSIK
ncbi:MAG: PAS domain-containing protein, partial [Candidatus Hadarchaeum sp.]